VSAVNKILIANRGEISLRVIWTARDLGLSTVSVYTPVDHGAAHTYAADQAYAIDSYLDIPALIEAATSAGADAVHPGYGFLSERAEFAAACRDAGLTFIGPPAEVIAALGRKDAARELAVAAQVPVLPDYRLGASDLVFPVLVKAAAGGGGKGMRIVREPDALADALESARREAKSAFGDDTMLIERFIERGRHVEVQILADEHGGVVHLGERDCSVQRRHQKIIEESPAPNLAPDLRERLLAAAVRLAAKVGYVNAGTVEFLVTEDEFFFLEMNTRLQVEHSVTEAVTGLDLVALQIAVADGKPLPFDQDSVRLSGHAIEARVYAEDAEHGFLPQPGPTGVVKWPDPPVRVDTALRSFDTVSASYDPMIAKLTVHESTRDLAAAALAEAVAGTRIDTLTTNLSFLHTVLTSHEFHAGQVHTSWLDQHPDLPFHLQLSPDGASPFDLRDGWRLGGPPVLSRPAGPEQDRAEDAAVKVSDGLVRAPMPGTVLAIKVSPGQQVQAGEPLGVLEAMKMEHTLTAPHDGEVESVEVGVGDQIPLSAVLFKVVAR
jgi:acetyl-CoA/propionyl-CoA carboxylase, biotin carboxylase, biotin carboxyl carrier protein